MFNLSDFKLYDMTHCGKLIRSFRDKCSSMEEAASSIVQLFHNDFLEESTNSFVLVRLFITRSYNELPEYLQKIASSTNTNQVPKPNTKCLTLIATAGVEKDWNDARKSKTHQVIPLVDDESVNQVPMFKGIVQQFGINTSDFFDNEQSIYIENCQKPYNVFFLPDARGHALIPAQKGFVDSYGIKSVIGFGGGLPNNDFFAVIMFSNITIAKHVAMMFKSLSLSVKYSILSYYNNIFSSSDSACGPNKPFGPDNSVQVLQERVNTLGDILDTTEDVIYQKAVQLQEAIDALKDSRDTLQITLNGAVNALSLASENRDPYTAGHQKRVALLTCAIAKELGLSDEHIDIIRTASILHDIGKIYVPAEILTKPGKLLDIEFNIIKHHSVVGYKILKKIQFSAPIAEIVYQHHEKLNGSGYPKGLVDDEILLEAKIICVADVVEAMASHRPYRAALGIDTALLEISSKKGTLFDTQTVEACLTVFNNGFTFKE